MNLLCVNSSRVRLYKIFNKYFKIYFFLKKTKIFFLKNYAIKNIEILFNLKKIILEKI